MPKGTRISFQMHYDSIGKEQTDQTNKAFTTGLSARR
jgi:hypothetical protein